MKRRRVYYLGLLGPATNGQCDITDLYSARFGQPRPGQKVFIVTCQTKDGWKAQESVFSAIVLPSPPSDRQQVPANTKVTAAPATEKLSPQAASAECSSLVPRLVYKGSTPDARGVHKCLKHEHPVSIPCTPLVHGVRIALSRLGMLGTFGT